MYNRLACWVVSFGLVVPLAPALADGLSGTYVGRGSNGAFLVQIVETADGHLTGRYEQVVLQPDGKIDDMNAVIAGAADGQTVVVTIKPSELLSGTIAASGTVEGRLLHLTGGGNGANLTLNLVRSDEADFRNQVAALTEQSRRMNEARARREAEQRHAKMEADQIANLQNLTERMTSFAAKADTMLPKFPPAEQRYRDITGRMRAALARERSIYGGGQASVARGQISVAINRAAIDANQLHISVGGAYRDFDFEANELGRESAAAGQGCRGTPVATEATPVPAGHPDRSAVCQRFFDAARTFAQRVSDLRGAFAEIEQVWRTERGEQDEIVQFSNRAVQ